MNKEKLCISFSGGRTSAYMTKLLIDNWSDRYELSVVFANTGIEDNRTLDFVDQCDKVFGFGTVWVEADVFHGERIGTGYKIIDYETANRTGNPFENVIKKYGIPNVSYPHCTRELKARPMKKYNQDIGFGDAQIAIGIRFDESRRVSKSDEYNVCYPLVYDFPTTKQDVLSWWRKQSFDLEIDEFEGNCLGCFKKSHKKQFMQIDRDPSIFTSFFKRMEDKYPSDRVFFRNNMNVDQLFSLHAEMKKHEQFDLFMDYDGEGTCSESCEVYPTEKIDE